MIKTKRISDRPSRQDGLRILVDRLWPRGLRKDEADFDLWLKDLAPSNELRTWYRHDPEKWPEFRRRYARELEQKGDLIALLKHRAGEGNVTLLFAARDEEHNNAVALRQWLENHGSGRKRGQR